MEVNKYTDKIFIHKYFYFTHKITKIVSLQKAKKKQTKIDQT